VICLSPHERDDRGMSILHAAKLVVVHAQFRARGIAVRDGVLRDEALATSARYRDAVAAGGITVYNARRG